MLIVMAVQLCSPTKAYHKGVPRRHPMKLSHKEVGRCVQRITEGSGMKHKVQLVVQVAFSSFMHCEVSGLVGWLAGLLAGRQGGCWVAKSGMERWLT